MMECYWGEIYLVVMEYFWWDFISVVVVFEEVFVIYLDGSVDLIEMFDFVWFYFGFDVEFVLGSDVVDVVGVVLDVEDDFGLVVLIDWVDLFWWCGFSEVGVCIWVCLFFVVLDD